MYYSSQLNTDELLSIQKRWMIRVDRDVYVDLQVRQKYNLWLPFHWQHVFFVFQVDPRLNKIRLYWSWNAMKVPLNLKKQFQQHMQPIRMFPSTHFWVPTHGLRTTAPGGILASHIIPTQMSMENYDGNYIHRGKLWLTQPLCLKTGHKVAACPRLQHFQKL